MRNRETRQCSQATATAARVQKQRAKTEIKKKQKRKVTGVEPGSEGWSGDEVSMEKAEVCRR